MSNPNRNECSYSEKPNNSDLIYRQDALEALRTCYETERIDYTNGNEYINYEQAVHEVEQLSSAQPERPKGNWVEIGDEPYDEWECDVCGFVIDGSGCIDPEEYRDVYKFCPNCGADMRGEQDE